MAIVLYNGNLLDSTATVIAHQTNCVGVMGAGVAREIRSRWPWVYNSYHELCAATSPNCLLGTVQVLHIEDGRYVANLFGQNQTWSQVPGGPATDYEALERAMYGLKDWMGKHGIKSLAMPYNIGCGLAGGDWPTVEGIILKVFGEANMTVELWKL